MFFYDKRKIAIIGCGSVGISYAFSLVNQGLCNEILLIDKDKRLAWGQAQDLAHGQVYSGDRMTVYSGGYEECIDADIAVICAGAPQHGTQDRIGLVHRNTEIFCDIIPRIADSGFTGLLVVATNPVDIMTQVAYDLSDFAPNKVIGSGTVLDTARLRHRLGGYFGIDPRSIHAYVIGEHGDSEFAVWSGAMIGSKRISDIISDSHGKYFAEDILRIEEDVRDSAYRIIEAKGNTCYGIAMALCRLTRAIYGDENSILTVSSMLEGEYDEQDVFIGTPCIINRDGVIAKVELSLNGAEEEKFRESCRFLRQVYSQLNYQPKRNRDMFTEN